MAHAKKVEPFHIRVDGLFFDFLSACDAQLNIAMSFGGPAWPISNEDMNLGPVGGGQCRGAIFDISVGSDISSSNDPVWIVGDTFLVRIFC